VIGGVGEGWTAAQTMLVYERGGGRAEDSAALGRERPRRASLLTGGVRPEAGVEKETYPPGDRPRPHDDFIQRQLGTVSARR